MRTLTLLALTATLGLSAQEDHPGGNRFAFGLAYLSPSGTWGSDFNGGFQAGLQVHFNRESRHLSRLRFDYLQADSKHLVPTLFVDPPRASSRMEGYSVMFEWMPHLENHSHSGGFAILGIGGTLWHETQRVPGTDWIDIDVRWALTMSGGLGWRFNRHATLEARYLKSEISFEGQKPYGRIRDSITLGTSLRF
jgi:hypothetical protein